MRQTIALLTLLFLSVACTQSQPTTTYVPTALPTPTATTSSLASTLASTPTTTHATPSALNHIFDQILTMVVEIRGLDPLNTIVPKFMTREQFADTLRKDLEESREDIQNSQDLLKIMGLIPQDADLYDMLLSLYGEQVVGFYDTEIEELYVIKGIAELTPLDELTLAHEYTHALQQQHFDIHTLSESVEDDSEAESALSALIEGDATTVQVEYMWAYLTSEQRQEIFNNSGDSPIFDASPYVLKQSLIFPYSEGADMVNTLFFSGELEDINSAYISPPVSTEQVMHPEKYLEGEVPVKVALANIAMALGQGWYMVYEDVIGEFLLKTYLETRISTTLAARAAAGWGGDRFNLIANHQGEQALIVLMEWDSERDAREFFNALDSSNSVSDEGFLWINEDRVLWVFSPSPAITDEIVSLFPEF